MNLAEATTLVAAVQDICPSQRMGPNTPAAWEMALYDIRAVDATEAVKRLSRRVTDPDDARYIEPGHIRGEVGRLRVERLDQHPPVEPPAGPAMSPRELMAWMRETRERIADGEIIEQPELPARKVDYSQVVKGVEDARVRLRAVPAGPPIADPPFDDRVSDPGGQIQLPAPHRGAEPRPASAEHGVDL